MPETTTQEVAVPERWPLDWRAVVVGAARPVFLSLLVAFLVTSGLLAWIAVEVRLSRRQMHEDAEATQRTIIETRR